jgi:type I restriction enzyme S subunit
VSLKSIAWPSSWRSQPLWALYDRVKDVGHPTEEMLSVYRDHGVVRKEGRTDNFNKTALNRSIYQLIHPGWLVVNRMKAWQGSVGISQFRGIVSGHYLCFRPQHDEESRFLNYLLRSGVYRDEMFRLSRGVRPNQIEIDNDWLRVLPVWLPPRDQQRRIADYLDNEVPRIEALIEAKERMISVARHASLRRLSERMGLAVRVTVAGPRPSSGLRCSKLWYVASVRGGVTLGKHYDEPTTEYPYLRVANVQEDRLDLTEVKTIAVPERDAATYAVQPGDLLLLEGNGNPDNLGRGVLWRGEIDGRVLHQNHVHVVRPGQRFLPEYLEAAIRTEWVRHYLTGGVGQVSIATLSQDRLSSLPIPVPSLSAQRATIAWWHEARGHTDDLTDTLAQQVELLRERRESLVKAAVTGELEAL